MKSLLGFELSCRTISYNQPNYTGISARLMHQSAEMDMVSPKFSENYSL